MKRLLALLTAAVLLAGSAYGADWPQLQGNPQRDGYTEDSPRPPYEIAWTFYFPLEDQKVYAQCQPVIYRGGVYVGTKMGRMYCFDAVDGKVRWRWDKADGPILNAAACDDGRVIFSSLDGKVRALDAATGQFVWEFDAGIHGFHAAPCLAEGKVFIGSRKGVFYALDAASGQPLWQRDMKAYIFCSAAWDDGRVYFGTEDMIFHCLDARDGRTLWKSPKLAGMSFRDFHPMIHNGRVLMRSYTNLDPLSVPASPAHVRPAVEAGRFAEVPADVSDMFQKFLAEHPEQQSLFVFDAKTGEVPFVPCHNRGGTNGGVAAVPCVDAQGRWFVALSSTKAPSDDKHWTGMIFATIDPANGRFGHFIWRTDHKRCNPDEQQNFSVGGDILFVAQQEEGDAGIFCAYNLTTAAFLPMPKSMNWMIGLNYDGEESGGHAFSISEDRFYHVSFHNLVCRRGPAAPPAAKPASQEGQP